MDHEVFDDENDWMEAFNNTQILSDYEEDGACAVVASKMSFLKCAFMSFMNSTHLRMPTEQIRAYY